MSITNEHRCVIPTGDGSPVRVSGLESTEVRAQSVGTTVLLVEDNPGDVLLLREILRGNIAATFEIAVVDSLATAMRHLDQNRVDVILLDLSLPDSHGLETVIKVHRRLPQVPIVVLSGLDDESLAIKALGEGAQDYLIKGHMDANLLVRAMRYAIERARVELALSQERDLFNTLMDNIPDSIYFKDEQSRFVRINRALGEKFGLADPDGAVGKTDFDFFSREHAQPMYDDEQQIIRTGQPLVGKVEKEALSDGRLTWVLSTKVPLRDECGRIGGIIGISKDITKLRHHEEQLEQLNADMKRSQIELLEVCERLKRTQAQLVQAEKLESIGRLAAGIAHEVKNPLAILLMGIVFLENSLPNGDPMTGSILRDMRDAVERADAIVRELLEYTSSRQLDATYVELNIVVDRALHLVHHELYVRHITVVREFADHLPGRWIDQIRIEQVFVNLFINACHAMQDGGTLTVRTFTRNDDVVVEVLDTGTGIPVEALPKVFDPFFTTKPIGTGTGMGLAVAKQILQQHASDIALSNRPTGGVCATVTFHNEKEPAHGN